MRQVAERAGFDAQRALFRRRAAWWRWWNKRLAWFLRDINGDRMSRERGYCQPPLPHYYYLLTRHDGVPQFEKVMATYYEKDPVGYKRTQVLFYEETGNA